MTSPEGLLFTNLELNIVDGTEKTEVQKITSFDGPNGSAAEIDMTHSKSAAILVAMGLPDNGNFNFQANYLPTDPGQAALEALRKSRSLANFEVNFDGLTTASKSFAGYVLNNSLSGASNGKINMATSIRISGETTDA